MQRISYLKLNRPKEKAHYVDSATSLLKEKKRKKKWQEDTAANPKGNHQEEKLPGKQGSKLMNCR